MQIQLDACVSEITAMLETPGTNFARRELLVSLVEKAGFDVRRTSKRDDAWILRCSRVWLRALLANLEARFPKIPLLCALFHLFNVRALELNRAATQTVLSSSNYGEKQLQIVLAHVHQLKGNPFDTVELVHEWRSFRPFLWKHRNTPASSAGPSVATDPVAADEDPRWAEVPKAAPNASEPSEPTPPLAADFIRGFLSDPSFVEAWPLMARLAVWYTTLVTNTADVERGVSILNLTHTDLRNRLKQSTLEALMYIKRNGPSIEEFDFDACARYHASRGMRAVRATSTAEQREEASAMEKIRASWGDDDIAYWVKREEKMQGAEEEAPPEETVSDDDDEPAFRVEAEAAKSLLEWEATGLASVVSIPLMSPASSSSSSSSSASLNAEADAKDDEEEEADGMVDDPEPVPSKRRAKVYVLTLLVHFCAGSRGTSGTCETGADVAGGCSVLSAVDKPRSGIQPQTRRGDGPL